MNGLRAEQEFVRADAGGDVENASNEGESE